MKNLEPPSLPFEFRDLGDDESSASFLLVVPARINSKQALLAALSQAGHFPDYFGKNWDALHDCLRDFDWIETRRIAVVHTDLPLHTHPRECQTYLEILRDSADDWGNTPGSPEHQLCVIFPASARSAVLDLLNP